MRARYYDAQIGRFISEDPIGFQGGLNLYAYVGGNPLLLVDPSGLGAELGGVSRGQIRQDAFDIAINVSGVGAVRKVSKSVEFVTKKVGNNLFGKGGFLNRGQNFRVGIGRSGGDSAFRVAGKSLGNIPLPIRNVLGIKEISPGVFKLDLWTRGKL